MANFYFTKYAIEGKKEVLNKLADVINSSDGMAKTVLDTLCLKYAKSKWKGLNRAEWENGARIEEHDGTTVLYFTQSYPSEHTSIIDWTLTKMGEPDAFIYFLTECFEDEVHETNDIDGMYFPERYRVFTEEDDDDVYFNTEDDAISHIRKQCGVPDSIEDIEDILDWCEDNDIECACDEIMVVQSSFKIRQNVLHNDTDDEKKENNSSNKQNKKVKKVKAIFSEDGKTLIHFPKKVSGEYNVPEGVTKIEMWAFDESDVDTIFLPDTVTDISSKAFFSDKLISVYLPRNLTVLNSYTFFCCTSLTFVDIPDSLETIGEGAFTDVGLKSLKIGKNIKRIEGCPIKHSKHFESIVVDAENPIYDSRDNCNAIIETKTNTLICGCNNTIIPNTVTKIKDLKCHSVSTMVIPDSVTEICEWAFKDNQDVQSISLSKNLKKIGERALSCMIKLTSIVIPEGVTVIEEGLCDYCLSLQSITIPSSVNEIHDFVTDCKKLKEIHIMNRHPEQIIVNFTHCLKEFSKCTIFVPTGTVEAYKQHPFFGKLKNIKEETITQQ